MNQRSDLNYLLNVKKILIEEIKILETSRSNPEYLDSLPIQNSEVRELVNSYKNTNSHINIDVSIQQKRELLKEGLFVKNTKDIKYVDFRLLLLEDLEYYKYYLL